MREEQGSIVDKAPPNGICRHLAGRAGLKEAGTVPARSERLQGDQLCFAIEEGGILLPLVGAFFIASDRHIAISSNGNRWSARMLHCFFLESHWVVVRCD